MGGAMRLKELLDCLAVGNRRLGSEFGYGQRCGSRGIFYGIQEIVRPGELGCQSSAEGVSCSSRIDGLHSECLD